MVIRLHKKRIWMVLLFVYLWLQSAVTHNLQGVLRTVSNYAAEGIVAVLLIMTIYVAITRRIRLLPVELVLLIGYAVFVVFGVISSIVYWMQSWTIAVMDLFVCSRFVLMYFITRILVTEETDRDQLLLDLAGVCRFFAVVTALLALHDLVMSPFFRQFEFRYFMRSMALFFPHPTYMAHACLTGAAVLMAANGKETRKPIYRRNMFCILLLALLMCVTLRVKAIAGAACILIFYFILIRWKVRSNGLLIGAGGGLALFIGIDQFNFYFKNTNAEDIVRAKLHVDAIDLAGRYFPFGTGFGTFGSSAAATHYSPLYYELGYTSINGGTGRFLSDSFWPTVIAQTGWIGTIGFLGVIVCFLILIFRAKKTHNYMFWSMLSLMAYLVITSVAESAFFNPTAGAMFALLGLLIGIVEQDRYAITDTTVDRY